MPNGTIGTTAPIPSGSNSYNIKVSIENACPNLKDKLAVWDGSTPYSDGRDIFIRFVSLNDDPVQLNISSASINPLTGGDPTKPIQLNSSTLVPYSTNQFYEPIPYEFLFTNEYVPQVEVSIDGQ